MVDMGPFFKLVWLADFELTSWLAGWPAAAVSGQSQGSFEAASRGKGQGKGEVVAEAEAEGNVNGLGINGRQWRRQSTSMATATCVNGDVNGLQSTAMDVDGALTSIDVH